MLDASLYGAPTRRKRLFVVARRDGLQTCWPAQTHGTIGNPVHTAAECIDWSIPCPSIFERKHPLAEKTLWRIAQGLRRFIFDNPNPFIVNLGGREHEVISTFMQRNGNGERTGQRARHEQLDLPLTTIMAEGQKHALVSAFLSRYFGDPLRSDGGGGRVVGQSLDSPLPTVTARDHHGLAAVTLAHFRGTSDSHPGCWDINEPMPTISAGGGRGGVHVGEVRAFLTAYYGNDGTGGQSLLEPTRTLTGLHRLGLVVIAGNLYQITDIGFRMLQPHELLRAQFGRFAAGYDLSRATTIRDQVFLIGNSVCPEVAEALVRANYYADERLAA